MKKLLAGILVGLLIAGSAALALTGCGDGGNISYSGSSALKPLVDAAAAKYQADNPNVTFAGQAGGSGNGLNNVLSKTVDIGNSDVYASEKLSASDAATLVDHKVCTIGVAVIVNSDVGTTVSSLTTDQLKSIFGGTISNWKEVGGPDEAITIINRPTTSGTRALFVKWALGGQADVDGDSSLSTDDSSVLMTYVSQTKGSIGYVALSYLVNPTANVSQVQLDGVDATYANIDNGTYQVWGYEHMYTYGTPGEMVQAFLDYMLTPDVESLASSMGYGAISSLDADAAASR